MSAAIPLQLSLPRRVWRAVRIAMLRYEIRSDERWIADCERARILTPHELDLCHAEVQRLRCLLAVLEYGR